MKKSFVSIAISSAMAAVGLGLSGCSDLRTVIRNATEAKSPDSVSAESVNIEIPDELTTSTDGKTYVNLADVKEVAKAMGIKLTGDPQQVLFKVKISGSARVGDWLSVGKASTVDRKVPITVGNLQEFAALYNKVDDLLLEGKLKQGEGAAR